MYEILNGITIKDKRFETGTIVDKKDIPQQSLKWLLEQKFIIKIDKKYQENKMQEIANAKVEEE